jgi:hypothetical protein
MKEYWSHSIEYPLMQELCTELTIKKKFKAQKKIIKSLMDNIKASGTQIQLRVLVTCQIITQIIWIKHVYGQIFNLKNMVGGKHHNLYIKYLNQNFHHIGLYKEVRNAFIHNQKKRSELIKEKMKSPYAWPFGLLGFGKSPYAPFDYPSNRSRLPDGLFANTPQA